MDWGLIILSGICALLGAVAGAIVSAMLRPLLSIMGNGVSRFLSTLIILISLCAGIALLPPYLKPVADPLLANFFDRETKEDDTIKVVEKKKI